MPNKGQKHSLETREKIRLAHIGKKHSEETKLKIKFANRHKYPKQIKSIEVTLHW